MSFGKDFNPAQPVGSDRASQLDIFIREDTKSALVERMALEHRSLDGSDGATNEPTDQAAAQGRHIPGKVGCLFVGTFTEIGSLSYPGYGSIAYATDLGNFFYLNNAGSWTVLTLTSDTIVPDDITLEIVGTSGSGAGILGMKHDHQQWVTTANILATTGDIDTDCNLSNSFNVSLNGAATFTAPVNQQAGATYIWVIKQLAAGVAEPVWGATFKWAGGIPPILTKTLNAVDIITGISDGTNIYCSALYDYS